MQSKQSPQLPTVIDLFELFPSDPEPEVTMIETLATHFSIPEKNQLIDIETKLRAATENRQIQLKTNMLENIARLKTSLSQCEAESTKVCENYISLLETAATIIAMQFTTTSKSMQKLTGLKETLQTLLKTKQG